METDSDIDSSYGNNSETHGGSTETIMQQKGYSPRIKGNILSYGMFNSNSRAPPTFQAKMMMNHRGDKFEKEADAVAEQVMKPNLSNSSSMTGGDKPSSICSSCIRNEKNYSRKLRITSKSTGPAGFQISERASDGIRTARTGGIPLPSSTREFMETRFGRDFGDVKVHTNSIAAGSADSINARAYTVGQDIIFGSNQYTPETARGRQLLAHELTHVIQQSGGTADSVIQDNSSSQYSLVGGNRGVTESLQRDPKDKPDQEDPELSCAIGMTPLFYQGNRGKERCIDERDPEFVSNYFDNNIDQAQAIAMPGTYWGNVSENRFAKLKLTYKDGRTLFFELKDIPYVDKPPVARNARQVRSVFFAKKYEKRADGFIYPIRAGGIDFGVADNIISLVSEWRDDVKQLQSALELIKAGVAFAGAIAALGGWASFSKSMGPKGLFESIPKNVGQEEAGSTAKPSTKPGRSLGQTQHDEPVNTTTSSSKTVPIRRTMTRVSTTDIATLKSEGFVHYATSKDGRSITYRNPITGDRVEITLRQGGPQWLKPNWGRSHIESEFRARGFKYARPTDAEGGQILRNQDTGEEIRIMQRPNGKNNDEPIEKHLNAYYFRYKSGANQPWGDHTTIPDK